MFLNSSLVIASAYMADALGWRSWYWMFSILSGISFILSLLFVLETYYDRLLPAYRGDSSSAINTNSHVVGGQSIQQQYVPRTFKSDLRLFVVEVNWTKTVTTFKQILQVFWFPHVLWMLVVVTVNAYLLVLLAASTVGSTYLMDSHPKRAGAILTVIPVTRGLISFGVSKNTVQYITATGALNTFGDYTGVGGMFLIMGIGVFLYGKKMRKCCAP